MFKPHTLLEHKQTGDVVAFIRLLTPKDAAVYRTCAIEDNAGWTHYEPISVPVIVTLVEYRPLYAEEWT